LPPREPALCWRRRVSGCARPLEAQVQSPSGKSVVG
jgi:hypothetical protein